MKTTLLAFLTATLLGVHSGCARPPRQTPQGEAGATEATVLIRLPPESKLTIRIANEDNGECPHRTGLVEVMGYCTN